MTTKTFYGTDDVVRLSGRSLDSIRGRLRRSSTFRQLFTKVSGVFVVEATNIEKVLEMLGSKPAAL
jgi:hypothetical protein